MSSWYDAINDVLKLKCDVCGTIVETYGGTSDRLLNNEYIKEHGWKTIKKDRWLNICPRCKEEMEEKKRAEWLKTV